MDEINELLKGSEYEKSTSQGLSEELISLVGDIILEFKKAGSITSSQLFDKLEKTQVTPEELEEIYKIFDNSGIQIINEFEKDKELYDQLYERILYDSLWPRYLLMRFYAEDSFTDVSFLQELNQFKEDCARVGVKSAGSLVSDIKNIDLKR